MSLLPSKANPREARAPQIKGKALGVGGSIPLNRHIIRPGPLLLGEEVVELEVWRQYSWELVYAGDVWRVGMCRRGLGVTVGIFGVNRV